MTHKNTHLRTIRSFVRRAGRMTKAQQQAIDTLWQDYGIDVQDNQQLDLDNIFSRQATKHLEIGFGRGEALLSMAQHFPEHDYLGIDIHLPGIGHVLNEVGKQNITNIRVIEADAVEILTHHLADQSLDTVYLFFPDPWHKKRHHKRRLVQPPFIHLLAQRIKPNGLLHLATDWEEYAQQMLSVLEASNDFINLTGKGQFSPRPSSRPETKYEKRGQRLGHQVWDLLYQRKN